MALPLAQMSCLVQSQPFMPHLLDGALGPVRMGPRCPAFLDMGQILSVWLWPHTSHFGTAFLNQDPEGLSTMFGSSLESSLGGSLPLPRRGCRPVHPGSGLPYRTVAHGLYQPSPRSFPVSGSMDPFRLRILCSSPQGRLVHELSSIFSLCSSLDRCLVFQRSCFLLYSSDLELQLLLASCFISAFHLASWLWAFG